MKISPFLFAQFKNSLYICRRKPLNIMKNSKQNTIASQSSTLNMDYVNSSITALLSKFDNGLELYQNNIVFRYCIEHLLQGGDIYKILEQVVVMQTKTQEKLSELIENKILRQEIIVSKERFDELVSGL